MIDTIKTIKVKIQEHQARHDTLAMQIQIAQTEASERRGAVVALTELIATLEESPQPAQDIPKV